MFFHKFLTSSCSELLLKFFPVSIVKYCQLGFVHIPLVEAYTRIFFWSRLFDIGLTSILSILFHKEQQEQF